MIEAAFSIGQIVHHKLFDYRGVIYDVDPVFQGTEEWYEQVAKSRPPKDRPWYHVLVDHQIVETYVAEQNLEPDRSIEPIEHPLVEKFFVNSEVGKGGVYTLRRISN
jgi:heat shock protein HspQ